MPLRVVSCPLVFAALLAAQSYQGEITGLVRDSSGGAIPGARIELVQLDTGVKRVVESDVQGRFYLLQLPPGPYRLEVSHTGFHPFERRLALEVGTRAVVDAVLEVGAVAESVQVEAAPPLLETAGGAIGTVVDNARINNLPLNGRNAYELVALSPGIIPTGAFGLAEPAEKRAQASFSAGGSRGLSNDLLLDG
ncbi:MAG: carboxypeptidase regulatory-like domain-containing protein, partial [Acidobacteria bacterium]|nr:carboxypeptidase regulatory-like domain-containing protein [Acidobacteriota bacterium]